MSATFRSYERRTSMKRVIAAGILVVLMTVSVAAQDKKAALMTVMVGAQDENADLPIAVIMTFAGNHKLTNPQIIFMLPSPSKDRDDMYFWATDIDPEGTKVLSPGDYTVRFKAAGKDDGPQMYLVTFSITGPDAEEKTTYLYAAYPLGDCSGLSGKKMLTWGCIHSTLLRSTKPSKPGLPF
jgi:hypothetical protein